MKNSDTDQHGPTFANRSGKDRRALRDRRRGFNLDFYKWGGIDQRRGKELRRPDTERREGWVRVGAWKSVYVGRHDG